MKSKTERLSDALINLDEACKYCISYLDSDFKLKKVTPRDYEKTKKSLTYIKSIISSFIMQEPYDHKALDQIRVILLSGKELYDEGDYDLVFGEIIKTNNDLCSDIKEKDRKKLGDLKRVFNNLTNFYKFRLTKAVYDENEGLSYRDKKIDNIKFLNDYYLTIRYNFKKVKYDTINISDTYLEKIKEYTIIISRDDFNDSIKEKYTCLRDYLICYAKAEIIISIFMEITKLCDNIKYQNIKKVVESLIIKYQKIYDENKANYELLITSLPPLKVIGKASSSKDASTKRQEDIKELKEMLASIQENIKLTSVAKKLKNNTK